MEKKDDPNIGEIEGETNPLLTRNPNVSSTVKAPEVEIHLYRRSVGPIAVFKLALGGYEQDQLEVRELCDKYGFKMIYAFSTESGRGVPIPCKLRDGRSLRSYKDGSVLYIDGEPKDSMIKPVTKILLGVAVVTIIIALTVKEKPGWIQKVSGVGGAFPPWILACMVIVFTRLRKRTRNFLKKYGW